MARPLIDLSGRRFGRLLVVRAVGAEGSRRWFCLCDCGSGFIADGGALRPGRTRSCGCLRTESAREKAERHVTHGLARKGQEHPLYQTWADMIRRCYNSDVIGFKYYGARGITVCERWRNDFAAFITDMGERPEGLTLDRKDNNGNYEPGNCRWATPLEQAQNRRQPQRRISK